MFKKEYDERCDVWSLGVVAFIILCGRKPFESIELPNHLDVSKSSLVSNIMMGRYSFQHPVSRHKEVQLRLEGWYLYWQYHTMLYMSPQRVISGRGWVCVCDCYLSCRVLSCRVVSCRIVSCRVVSCRVVSCRVVSCCVSAPVTIIMI